MKHLPFTFEEFQAQMSGTLTYRAYKLVVAIVLAIETVIWRLCPPRFYGWLDEHLNPWVISMLRRDPVVREWNRMVDEMR